MNAILPWAIGLVALLEASVGHAGATGSIAVMTLLGMSPPVIGGAEGSHLGAFRLPVGILKAVLAAVLGFAGLKMLGLG